MNILIYSFNDKIGDGLQKVTFLQSLKNIYPNSKIYYTTTHTTTFKSKLHPLVKDIIFEIIENNGINSSISNIFKKSQVGPKQSRKSEESNPSQDTILSRVVGKENNVSFAIFPVNNPMYQVHVSSLPVTYTLVRDGRQKKGILQIW